MRLPRIENVIYFPKHVTPWEKEKKLETMRLTGVIEMPSIEEHRFSRQSGGKLEPIGYRGDSAYDRPYYAGHRENRANARDRHIRSALKASGDRPHC